MQKLEAYIAIEEGLRRRLRQRWAEATAGLASALKRDVEGGHYDRADARIKAIDCAIIAQDTEMDVRRTGYLALIYGAMLAHGGERVKYLSEPVPPVMDATVAQIAKTFERARDMIAKLVVDAYTARELAKAEEDHECDGACAVRIDLIKGTMTLAQRLNAAVDAGTTIIDIGANATTTRLAGLGFLDQAQTDGITTYQITGALDGRMCPVCRTIHGQTFQVGPEYGRLLNLAQQTDPEVLKTMAPWPSQSKANVSHLRGLDAVQLQGMGLGSPPYHGGCRCRQVVVGTVPLSELLHADKTPSNLASIQTPDVDSAMHPEAESVARSLMGMKDKDIAALKKLNVERAQIKVTKDELTALAAYRQKPYGASGDTDQWQALKAAATRNLVAGTVYRSVPDEVVQKIGDALDKDEPFDLSPNWVVPTTAYKKVALAHQKTKPSKVMWEIAGPTVRGVYTSALFGGNAEAEYLLQPGLRLAVTKRWQKDGVQWYRLKGL